LNHIFETLDYGFDLNYSDSPPPPELSEEQKKWVEELLATTVKDAK